MTNETGENEPRSPILSGWRKAVLWLAGAAALAAVGYRGTLGTEMAAAAPPQIAAAPPITGGEERSPPAKTTPTLEASGTPLARTAATGTPPKGATTGESTPPLDGAPTARGQPAVPGAVTAITGRSAGAGEPENHVAAASPVAAITPDGKVVLNLASEAELRKLPGIGKSRARAIVEQRERVGRFRRLEDLLRVKGIGPKRLAALRARLVLDAP